MKLDVVPSPAPWHRDGLQFTCQQCGNCCTGGPGYVWVSDVELARLAEFLKMSEKDVIATYCRRVHGKISLKETRRGELYDCVFLREQKPGEQIIDAKTGEAISLSTRVCRVYPVRPLQCRTWPFWDGNLASEGAWKRAAKGCHGMNQGRKFTLEEIVELRDAKDWPERPPTSGTT